MMFGLIFFVFVFEFVHLQGYKLVYRFKGKMGRSRKCKFGHQTMESRGKFRGPRDRFWSFTGKQQRGIHTNTSRECLLVRHKRRSNPEVHTQDSETLRRVKSSGARRLSHGHFEPSVATFSQAEDNALRAGFVYTWYLFLGMCRTDAPNGRRYPA